MVRDYELMYIVRPDLDEDGLQAAVDSVEQIVGGAGGEVVRSTSWGRRRLAYEVDHLRDGHYMLLHVRLEGPRVAEVERALAIHETVFRHLLVLREAEGPAASEGPATAEGDAPAGEDGGTRQTAVAATADNEPDGDDEDGEDAEPPATLADDDEEEI